MSNRGRNYKGKGLPPGYLLYKKCKAAEGREKAARTPHGKWAGPILGHFFIEI